MSKQEILKNLPSIEQLININAINKLSANFSHEFIVYLCRKSVKNARNAILNKKYKSGSDENDLVKYICSTVLEEADSFLTGAMIPVINGTGVILHTGLGRAPMSDAAYERVKNIARGYSLLEIDRSTGGRGKREDRIEEILCFLTGAEAATVVNNNAAAVMIALQATASGKEVIVSRGELVEIGGSFRMPDIVKASGATMKEVGTTNKTKISDIEKAISDKTGAVLTVHTSNFRVMGFTETVPLKEISAAAQSHNIPHIYDLGGGVIYDLQQLGLPYEPAVGDAIKADADIIMFSGDKVLGGPQSGIIVGKKEYLDKIKRAPMARAIRCDKMILAALEGTLLEYLKGIDGFKNLPASRMMSEPPEEVKKRAENLVALINNNSLTCSVSPGQSEAGSGALPLEKIESFTVQIISKSSEKIASALRENAPPIFGYISKDKFHIDLRTVFTDQVQTVAEEVEFFTLMEEISLLFTLSRRC